MAAVTEHHDLSGAEQLKSTLSILDARSQKSTRFVLPTPAPRADPVAVASVSRAEQKRVGGSEGWE